MLYGNSIQGPRLTSPQIISGLHATGRNNCFVGGVPPILEAYTGRFIIVFLQGKRHWGVFTLYELKYAGGCPAVQQDGNAISPPRTTHLSNNASQLPFRWLYWLTLCLEIAHFGVIQSPPIFPDSPGARGEYWDACQFPILSEFVIFNKRICGVKSSAGY